MYTCSVHFIVRMYIQYTIHVCTCMYMYVHVHVCTCMYMYVHVCTCMYMYVHVCTCMYMYVHVCTCMYMYVHVCTCMYMYVHVCTCMYMYVLHVHTGSRRHLNFVYRHKSIRLPWPRLVVKSNLLKSQVTKIFRLESTINTAIEGVHVHRSIKLFLVSLRGLRGAPQSLSTARTPHARPSLCPRKIPVGTRGVPYPPCSLLAGPRSVLAGVWNYLWLVLYLEFTL